MNILDFKYKCKKFLEENDKKISSIFIYRKKIEEIWDKGNIDFYDPYSLKIFNTNLYFDGFLIKIKFKFNQKLECYIESPSKILLLDEEKLEVVEEYEQIAYIFIKLLYLEYFKNELDEDFLPINSCSDIIYSQ